MKILWMELETKVFWTVHKYAKLYNYENPGESQGFFWLCFKVR